MIETVQIVADTASAFPVEKLYALIALGALALAAYCVRVVSVLAGKRARE
jgi:hypothetical protein